MNHQEKKYDCFLSLHIWKGEYYHIWMSRCFSISLMFSNTLKYKWTATCLLSLCFFFPDAGFAVERYSGDKGTSVLPRLCFLFVRSLRSIKTPHLCENSFGIAFEVLGLGYACQSAFLTTTLIAEIVKQYPQLHPVDFCRERCEKYLRCQARNCVLSRCSAGAV